METDPNMNFLNTPAGGQAKATRESIRGEFHAKYGKNPNKKSKINIPEFPTN